MSDNDVVNPFMKKDKQRLLTENEIKTIQDHFFNEYEKIESSEMDTFGKGIEKCIIQEMLLRSLAVEQIDPSTNEIYYNVIGKIMSKSTLHSLFDSLHEEISNLEQSRRVYKENLIAMGKEIAQNPKVFEETNPPETKINDKDIPINVSKDATTTTTMKSSSSSLSSSSSSPSVPLSSSIFSESLAPAISFPPLPSSLLSSSLSSSSSSSQSPGLESEPNKDTDKQNATKNKTNKVFNERPTRHISKSKVYSNAYMPSTKTIANTAVLSMMNPLKLILYSTKFVKDTIRDIGINIDLESVNKGLTWWERTMTGKTWMARDRLPPQIYKVLNDNPSLRDQIQADIYGYQRDLSKCVFVKIPIDREINTPLNVLREKDAWRIWSYPLDNGTDLCYDIVDLYNYIKKYEEIGLLDELGNIRIPNPAQNSQVRLGKIDFEPDEIYAAKNWYEGYMQLQQVLQTVNFDQETKNIMSHLAKDPDAFWLTEEDAQANAKPGFVARSLRFLHKSFRPWIFKVLLLMADVIRMWLSQHSVATIMLSNISTPSLREAFTKNSSLWHAMWRCFKSSLLWKINFIYKHLYHLPMFTNPSMEGIWHNNNYITRIFNWSVTTFSSFSGFHENVIKSLGKMGKDVLITIATLEFLSPITDKIKEWGWGDMLPTVSTPIYNIVYTAITDTFWTDKQWDTLYTSSSSSSPQESEEEKSIKFKIVSFLETQNTFVRGNFITRRVLQTFAYVINRLLFSRGEKAYWTLDRAIHIGFNTINVFFLANSMLGTIVDAIALYQYQTTGNEESLWWLNNDYNPFQTDIHKQFMSRTNMMVPIVTIQALDERRVEMKKQADSSGGAVMKMCQVINDAFLTSTSLPTSIMPTAKFLQEPLNQDKCKKLWNMLRTVQLYDSKTEKGYNNDKVGQNMWSLFNEHINKVPDETKPWISLIQQVAANTYGYTTMFDPSSSKHALNASVDDLINRSSLRGLLVALTNHNQTGTILLRDFLIDENHKDMKYHTIGESWGYASLPDMSLIKNVITVYFDWRIHSGSATSTDKINSSIFDRLYNYVSNSQADIQPSTEPLGIEELNIAKFLVYGDKSM